MSQSRAALSLLGYCYYHIQDFTNAAECYEQLTQLHPEVEEYKLYYAQSLYKAGAYPEATKASFVLDNPNSHTKVQNKHTQTHNITIFQQVSLDSFVSCLSRCSMTATDLQIKNDSTLDFSLCSLHLLHIFHHREHLFKISGITNGYGLEEHNK